MVNVLMTLFGINWGKEANETMILFSLFINSNKNQELQKQVKCNMEAY
jgi:hypothetical protein